MNHSPTYLAKFLRAHAGYLMGQDAPWPFVNSALAISVVNNQAANVLEKSPDAAGEALKMCAGFAEGVLGNRKPGDLTGKAAANEILTFIEDLIAERESN